MAEKKKIGWDKKPKSGIWKERKLSQTQLDTLELWRVFNLRQKGSMPPQLAADYLRMSTAGVRKAGSRGWISFVRIGGVRYYGKKDLENYRYTVSRKFPENQERYKKASPEFRISDLPPS